MSLARIRSALGKAFRRPDYDWLDVTDEGVSATFKDGSVRAVRWDELTCVRIRTTASGPWREDLFFILEAVGDTGCVIPQYATDQEFIKRLQRFPGFDNRQLILAMGCTSHAEFICWTADDEREIGSPQA